MIFVIDYAYMEDDLLPDLPYHICIIRGFKMVSYIAIPKYK